MPCVTRKIGDWAREAIRGRQDRYEWESEMRGIAWRVLVLSRGRTAEGTMCHLLDGLVPVAYQQVQEKANQEGTIEVFTVLHHTC